MRNDNLVFVRLTLDGRPYAFPKLVLACRLRCQLSNANYRVLNQLAPATIAVTAHLDRGTDRGTVKKHRIEVHLKNTSSVVALNTKLGLFNAADDSEVLPAYHSDNYISLLRS